MPCCSLPYVMENMAHGCPQVFPPGYEDATFAVTVDPVQQTLALAREHIAKARARIRVEAAEAESAELMSQEALDAAKAKRMRLIEEDLTRQETQARIDAAKIRVEHEAMLRAYNPFQEPEKPTESGEESPPVEAEPMVVEEEAPVGETKRDAEAEDAAAKATAEAEEHFMERFFEAHPNGFSYNDVTVEDPTTPAGEMANDRVASSKRRVVPREARKSHGARKGDA